MTHNYKAALETLIKIKSVKELPDQETIDRTSEACHAALTLAAKMQDKGYVAVPEQASAKMYEAGKAQINECAELNIKSVAAWVYRAMIAAAEPIETEAK